MDPVTFRVSGRKKWYFESFFRRDMTCQYPFMYRITCCPLAIIFNMPVLFLLMEISKVTFRK